MTVGKSLTTASAKTYAVGAKEGQGILAVLGE